MEPGTLLFYEWLMVLAFVAGLIIWGFYYKKHNPRTLDASFLAGRKVPGFIASLSTVATNMNANDFIGMAGAIYGAGIVMLHQPMINAVVLVFLGVVVMKKLRGRNVYSLGQWLRERYSDRVGHAYSLIWALVWMLFNLGLYIYSGALVMYTLVGWNLYASIVILSLIAALYTLLGGFRAVVATDVVQMLLMFFPFIILSVLVWQEVGGPVALLNSLPADKANLWYPSTHFGPLGMTIGGMLLIAMSYWSSEAQVVQRPLAARDPDAATTSYIGASFWYAGLVPFVVFLPALAALKLYPGLPNNDFATPMLLKEFLPHGLYGLTIVGLLAGVFSSCDSQINAFCTIFTTDIYKGMLRRNADTDHYLRVSRIAGVVFTLVAIGTAVIFSFAKHGMFLFAVGIVATIMPPFGAITILGAIWRRTSPRAAWWGVLLGMTYAVALFVLDLTGQLAHWASDTLYLRSGSTFLVTTAVAVLFSSRDRHLDTLSPLEPASDSPRSRRQEKLLGASLLVVVTSIYLAVSLMR